MSTDDESTFLELLDRYLAPASEANPDMVGVEIIWVEDSVRLGAQHMEKHGVSMREVEEVLTQIPPYVRAKRSPKHRERTVFWGATQHDRWLIVVCEDWKEDGVRYLKPITAFEPDDGEAYWSRL